MPRIVASSQTLQRARTVGHILRLGTEPRQRIDLSRRSLADGVFALGHQLGAREAYDPEARGKMERFWRTLRQGCLDHLGHVGSLNDINQRLAVFLERHYHRAPHAGLMGRAPLSVYAPAERQPNHVTESQLREALAVRERRRVRRDTTVSVIGCIYELQQGFLAGRVVDVVYSYLDDPPLPEVEYESKRYPLSLVDPVANSRRRRTLRHPESSTPRTPVAFDPSCTTSANSGDEEANDAND